MKFLAAVGVGALGSLSLGLPPSPVPPTLFVVVLDDPPDECKCEESSSESISYGTGWDGAGQVELTPQSFTADHGVCDDTEFCETYEEQGCRYRDYEVTANHPVNNGNHCLDPFFNGPAGAITGEMNEQETYIYFPKETEVYEEDGFLGESCSSMDSENGGDSEFRLWCNEFNPPEDMIIGTITRSCGACEGSEVEAQ